MEPDDGQAFSGMPFQGAISAALSQLLPQQQKQAPAPPPAQPAMTSAANPFITPPAPVQPPPAQPFSLASSAPPTDGGANGLSQPSGAGAPAANPFLTPVGQGTKPPPQNGSAIFS